VATSLRRQKPRGRLLEKKTAQEAFESDKRSASVFAICGSFPGSRFRIRGALIEICGFFAGRAVDPKSRGPRYTYSWLRREKCKGRSACATLQAAINVATVPDPDHQNNQPNILDRVDDPIVSRAETKQVRLTLQFLHPWQTRIDCQPVDAFFDPLLVMAGKL
jgi:hypothetical protein